MSDSRDERLREILEHYFGRENKGEYPAEMGKWHNEVSLQKALSAIKQEYSQDADLTAAYMAGFEKGKDSKVKADNGRTNFCPICEAREREVKAEPKCPVHNDTRCYCDPRPDFFKSESEVENV